MEATTLSTYLTNLGSVVTQMTTWVTTTATNVIAHPLFLVPVGVLTFHSVVRAFRHLL